jgi:hypothetical protein
MIIVIVLVAVALYLGNAILHRYQDVKREANLEHTARLLEERPDAVRRLRETLAVTSAGHEVGARDRHDDAVERRVGTLAAQHVQKRVPAL